jgi:phosphate transport system substrate-binding protein
MAEVARQLYAARHEELRQLAAKETPRARELGLDVLTFPRLDGSTSTHPLSVILVSRVLGTPYEWIYAEPTGSPWRPRPNLPMDLFLFNEYEYYPPVEKMEFTLAASRVVAKPRQAGQERVPIMINSLLAISTSTHDAYTNLIERKCDLNLTARAPSGDELAAAKKKGVTIELRPIAKDALVFILNRNNPVKSIGGQEVVQIYQGKIKTWAQFGGPAASIVPLWRERNSGSRELFDALVSKRQHLAEPPLGNELFSNSMSGPFNRVTQEANSLGYSVFYYEHFMALSAYTRTVAIDGIEPNAESIASGKYPFTAKVYAAYRSDEPQNSPAMKLLAWLLSPEGQGVVRESGYVPVNSN